MPSWFVYIAKAKKDKFYTGISTNPKQRITEHNIGKGSKFAVNNGPLVLVYISRPFPNKSEVRKREVQIKNWSRVKKLNL